MEIWVKCIPCMPRFFERLIGTVRREFLDRTLFWNQGELERKLDNYRAYYNWHPCHTGLAEVTPANQSGVPPPPIANLSHIPGGNIATDYFRPQSPPNWNWTQTFFQQPQGRPECVIHLS
jgi:hypothetical protein